MKRKSFCILNKENIRFDAIIKLFRVNTKTALEHINLEIEHLSSLSVPQESTLQYLHLKFLSVAVG